MIPGGSATTTATSRRASARASGDAAFYAACAIAFGAAAAGTVGLCRSMAGGMDMPGGWTMSMTWMKMPGQSWPSAALMFLEMWLVMMVAMMMPSLTPMLARYRRSLAGRPDVGRSTLIAAIAYFAVWLAVGVAAYPMGVALALSTMWSTALSRAIVTLSAASLLLAGTFQLSPWKMRKLRHCRDPEACAARPCPPGAWSHGIDLGVCCASCCAGFMLALLVLGAMDLAVMAFITLAITAERVAPKPQIAARLSGAALLATALVLIVRS